MTDIGNAVELKCAGRLFLQLGPETAGRLHGDLEGGQLAFEVGGECVEAYACDGGPQVRARVGGADSSAPEIATQCLLDEIPACLSMDHRTVASWGGVSRGFLPTRASPPCGVRRHGEASCTSPAEDG